MLNCHLQQWAVENQSKELVRGYSGDRGKSPGTDDLKLGCEGWEGVCQVAGVTAGEAVPGTVYGTCKEERES